MPLMLGAPGIQTLRFQAAQVGQTRLRLVYRRPWEEDVPPAEEFSLSVEAIGPFTQPPPTHMVSAPQPTSPLSVDLGEAGQLGLPSAFNWCILGACTPVKDQGGCGSCWAFSTVGPLESNILYRDGIERDLSEQYLLSCNTDGSSCRGGWFAHEYHEWKIPPLEPEAGAVYEADFPYTAQEDPCDPPHTHHEKIVDWAYVGNYYSVPSVTAIKQAILDHGPVSVAICTRSAFQNYDGDIFLTDECGSVNHAVVLVGWDDSQGPNGIWFLRNSWGPYWGEGGYMRIGYGISSVGYAANYATYDPTCYDLDTEVYPAGTGTVVSDAPPNCNGGGYEPDTVVELTANGNPGWHFFAWGGDASGSENPIDITMDSDKGVAAHFMCDGCTPQAHFPLVMRE
jgi:inhibitor of cysteine peptidase